MEGNGFTADTRQDNFAAAAKLEGGLAFVGQLLGNWLR
jgi:hypothetical protein